MTSDFYLRCGQNSIHAVDKILSTAKTEFGDVKSKSVRPREGDKK